MSSLESVLNSGRKKKKMGGKKNHKDSILFNLCNDKDDLSNVDVPESIHIHFREDYNILSIHRIVLKKLTEEINKREAMNVFISLKEIQLLLADTGTHFNSLEREIKLLKEERDIKCDPERKNNYLRLSTPLLEKYQNIPKPERCLSGNSSYHPTRVDFERLDIIKEYIKLASNYIVINYNCTGDRPSDYESLCYNCEGNLSSYLCDINYIKYCPLCNAKCDIKRVNSKVSRSDFDDTKPASTRNDLTNYIKAIHHYQGKIRLPDAKMEEITLLLDKYFEANRLPIGREVKEQFPLNSKGQRIGTNIDMMIRAMKEKQIDCYNYINYICKEYWGWILRNIGSLEDILISDYNKMQPVRSSLTIEERGGKSNIPVNLRLCKDLMRRGWDCNEGDFKLTSDASKYIRGYEIMCNNCGDPHIYDRVVDL